MLASVALMLITTPALAAGSTATSDVAKPSLIQAQVQPVKEGDDVQTARQWIALIDEQKWQDSWVASGDQFRMQLTGEQWAKVMDALRVPLGSVRTRTLLSTSPLPTPPNALAGSYRIIQFTTAFAQRPEAVETIVLYQQGNNWMVVGYFIR